MATLLAEYKRTACGVRESNIADPAAEWAALHDWWPIGRQMFEQLFESEVGKAPSKASLDDLLGAAIPKSIGDLERKEADDAYYVAHAALFMQEMDAIVRRVPRSHSDARAASAFGNVVRFASNVMFDSVVLLEHWAERSQQVPGAYGVGKNEAEHLDSFLFGAQQIIYGHGSFGLSFVESHSDIVIGTIRQAIEIRLRRAFGIHGRISEKTNAFEPVPISALFDAIRPFEAQIFSEVPFPILRRINGWTNMYLHGGHKLPAWTAPRVLARLKPLILGEGRKPGDGIRMDKRIFDGVRQGLKERYDATTSPIGLYPDHLCEAVITADVAPAEDI